MFMRLGFLLVVIVTKASNIRGREEGEGGQRANRETRTLLSILKLSVIL